VAVSCVAQAVAVQQTNQCTANVQGTGNYSKEVNWAVNGVSGGNITLGTVSSSGLFIAPAMVPSPASVTVSATSTADASKSANSPVTVTLSVAVSPATATVQLFHPQQFTATVKGVSNTAVNWQVGGNTGGNSTSGTISASGMYVPPIAIPATGTVTVTAISQADTTESASAKITLANDSTAPAVISTIPTPGATAVSVQPSIQIAFNEALDPATVSGVSVALSSGTAQQPINLGYNSSTYTITIDPVNLLAPNAKYSVQIAQSLHDLGGNALAAPYSFAFTVEGPTGVTGSAAFPKGIDPTTTVVSSFRGQQSVPDSSGSFNATIATVGTTLLGSSLSTQSSALLAVGVSSTSSATGSSVVSSKTAEARSAESIRVLTEPGKRPVFFRRHQITASAAAVNTSSDLVMDFQTTAEALLFYSPALMNSTPQVSNQILADIAADPNTMVLATALAAAWNESHPMQDPAVKAAYENALQSILQTVVAQVPVAAQANARRKSDKGSVGKDSTASSSANTGTPVITPIDVCCIDMPPFAAEGSNFTSSFGVKFGRASGWFMRIVELPSSFDPSQLVPSNGSSSNSDSPVPVSGEDQQGSAPIWLPGNSIFQYGDLYGDIGMLVSGVASEVTGLSPASSSNVSLPSSPSAYYLARFYSGGTGDPDEMWLVSGGGIYAGQQLWRSTVIANDMVVAVDLLNATNLIPSDVVTCETTALVPEIPKIASDVGFTNGGWNTFMQVSGDVWGSFATNIVPCFTSNALENVFEMIGDASKLASIAGTIVDGLNSVSQASDAIQIVTEQALDTPVDTALIQVGNAAGGVVASVSLAPSSLSLSVGASANATATTYDSSKSPVSNASVVWSIGDPSIATLSASGNNVQVTGVSKGTTQLTVTSANGASAFIPVGVSATTAGPFVGGVLPTPVAPLNNPQTLQIYGNNFQSGATLTYHDPQGNAYSARSATFVNAGQLTDPVFNNGNDSGTWTVMVVNPGGQTSSAYSFTVSASTPAPSITGVSPSPVPGSSSVQKLTINGSNFASGATLTYHDPLGNFYPGHSSMFVSSGQLTDTAFNNANAAGTWTVTVINPGAVSSNTFSFTVSAGATPTVSSITPSGIPVGSGTQLVMITGTGFTSSSHHQFSVNGGSTWTWATVAPVSITSTTMTVDVNNTVAQTIYLRVCTSNGSTVCSNSMSVTVSAAATPTVSSITPNSIPVGSGTQLVTITGTGFTSSSYHQFSVNGGSTWTWATVAPVSITSTTMTVDVNNTVAQTIYLRVCTSNGSAVCSNSMSVTVSAAATPNVTGVSPSPVPGSSSAQQLTIYGSSFASGATLTYHDPLGNFYPGHGTTFVSSGQLVDPSFNDANAVGTWTVTVINPGAVSSNTFAFTVAVAGTAPTVTTTAATSISSTGGTFNGTVNPNGLSTSVWFQWGTTASLGQSSTPATITGTTAVPESTVLSGALPNTTYYFRMAAQNSAGTNYGSTLSFTTSSTAPTVSYVTPSTISKGTSSQLVTITGTGFTSSSYHQYSTNGGAQWAWATSAPYSITPPSSMTIYVNNTVAQTIYYRVCTFNGSSVCSNSVAVTVQ
jgi:hypothetical protein